MSKAPDRQRQGESGHLWEDEALRTLSPAEVAVKTGRTLKAVYLRRRKLGMQNGRKNSGRRRKVVA